MQWGINLSIELLKTYKLTNETDNYCNNHMGNS